VTTIEARRRCAARAKPPDRRSSSPGGAEAGPSAAPPEGAPPRAGIGHIPRGSFSPPALWLPMATPRRRRCARHRDDGQDALGLHQYTFAPLYESPSTRRWGARLRVRQPARPAAQSVHDRQDVPIPAATLRLRHQRDGAVGSRWRHLSLSTRIYWDWAPRSTAKSCTISRGTSTPRDERRAGARRRSRYAPRAVSSPRPGVRGSSCAFRGTSNRLRGAYAGNFLSGGLARVSACVQVGGFAALE